MASEVGALPILINRILAHIFRDISRNKQLGTVWIKKQCSRKFRYFVGYRMRCFGCSPGVDFKGTPKSDH
ncbi:hypothetical protein T11_9046 [Trichinella zimbabwensis]|uniref:Uncharacterized protein n=1 Tax=Trichinella zimbabwensis TaxID=268475 RepID=A0A0V1HII9_9BILA|nr:hypothetical protein T11_9046 [Trichinella zimbabwensis]